VGVEAVEFFVDVGLLGDKHYLLFESGGVYLQLQLGELGFDAFGLSGEDRLKLRQFARADVFGGAAGDIAEIAGSLGDALSDIVWSLRPESVTTRAQLARLREQARRLVPWPAP
jgi:hypothetical protein